MKRKATIGLTLAALLGLGALAAYAADADVVVPRAGMGPHFRNYMVARRDVGTGGPGTKPTIPTKPPNVDAMSGAGRSLSGHSTIGGSLSSGSISPQTALEGSLKSLALELR
jgi:hypothetical protein